MKEPATLRAIELDVAGLSRRRPEAISQWFQIYADLVYSFIYYRVGRDPDLAAEVAQDTFVTALEKITEFDPGRGEMLPWLTYLARNRIRKALKSRARYTDSGDVWEKIDRRLLAAFTNLAHAPLPDEAFEHEETGELVRMALSNLPLRYQHASKEHYFHQSSLREIAEADGLTEGAVKSLLHRARSAFQAAFEVIAEGGAR